MSFNIYKGENASFINNTTISSVSLEGPTPNTSIESFILSPGTELIIKEAARVNSLDNELS